METSELAPLVLIDSKNIRGDVEDIYVEKMEYQTTNKIQIEVIDPFMDGQRIKQNIEYLQNKYSQMKMEDFNVRIVIKHSVPKDTLEDMKRNHAKA